MGISVSLLHVSNDYDQWNNLEPSEQKRRYSNNGCNRYF